MVAMEEIVTRKLLPINGNSSLRVGIGLMFKAQITQVMTRHLLIRPSVIDGLPEIVAEK